MSITDNKITRWNNPIANDADRPQRSASSMKEVFDSNSNQLGAALNNLIDALAQGGASDIGAAVEGMEGNTIENILAELKSLIDSAGEDLDDLKAAVLPEGDGSLFLANNGEWKLPSVGAAANGVKAGGNVGDVYVKKSLTVYDGEWVDPAELGFLQEGDTVSKAEDADMLGGKLPSEYQEAGSYASPAILRTVTLGAAEWTGAEAPFTQTVTASGVLADTTKQAIHVSPAPGYGTMYGSAGIECTVQAANSLTFSCEAAPESDITVNIVIQEAKV